jgi:hypothetical protein
MMKVGSGYTIGLKYHVILRKTEGMEDIQSQEFLGVADTG